MWSEDERFFVRDDTCARHTVVKMVSREIARSAASTQNLRSEISFFFLLDGSDVTALLGGVFRNDRTGEILTCVARDE